MKRGVYVAVPEKAFLDKVHFVVRGKAGLDYDEIDFKIVSIKALLDFSTRFPKNVQNFVEKLLRS